MEKELFSLKDIADIHIKEGVEFTKINIMVRRDVIAVIKQPNTNLIDLFQTK